jgi:hypothetical protein
VEVTYHPLVRRDMTEAIRYYNAISTRLADEFEEEMRLIIAQAAADPRRFHPADHGFRRANLRRFPYHILYEIRTQSICVICPAQQAASRSRHAADLKILKSIGPIDPGKSCTVTGASAAPEIAI